MREPQCRCVDSDIANSHILREGTLTYHYKKKNDVPEILCSGGIGYGVYSGYTKQDEADHSLFARKHACEKWRR